MTDKVTRTRRRPTFGRIMRLTRKELRETLRDRRTVITLVLMPLLVYPLLSIAFNKSLLLTMQQSSQTVYVIGVDSIREKEILEQLLVSGDMLLAKRDKSPDDGKSPDADEVQPSFSPQETFEVRWFSGSPLENHVTQLQVHMAVRMRFQSKLINERMRFTPVKCELIYQKNSLVSRRAMRYVEDRLNVVNEASLRNRLAQFRLPARVPASISRTPLVVGRIAPFSLATLVPLVLILMTITGAVYPAIDLTAGERERGTLESLIAAPISRVEVLVAKYAAVLTVAVLTAMVNLVAMTATLLSSSLGQQLFPGSVSLTLMVEIFGLLVLFAAFFSAILLTLTSFARSFKEAQAYLIPVMLLAISPGLLSLTPGLQLNGLLAVTPLVNIVLLARDLLEGVAEPGMALLAVLSTVVYAVAAIALASRVFGNDALLYASRGSWSDLFRRPSNRRDSATPTAAIACLATMFPCFFLLANVGRMMAADLPEDLTVKGQLIVNAGVTMVVFGLCPVLFAFAQRVDIRSGFQLRRASLVSILAAALLGISVWPMAHEIFLLGKWMGLVSLDKDQFAAVERLLRSFQGLSPVLILTTLSVVPAVMEEFFFRGYLFRGLSNRFGPLGTIVASGLLFGLFHVLTPSVLTPERFLPSAFMGLVLGWVCYRTKSVLPGMVLHACHNGLLLLMAQNRGMLVNRGWNLEGSEHLPMAWLILSGVLMVFSAVFVYYATASRIKS